MRMSCRAWLSAAGLPALTLLSPAQADDSPPEFVASDLSMFCQSHDLAVHNACKFFILGAFTAFGTVGVIQGRKVCIPDNLSSAAMEFAVRDHMARDFEFYPDDRKMPAIAMVAAAIVATFPCDRHR